MSNIIIIIISRYPYLYYFSYLHSFVCTYICTYVRTYVAREHKNSSCMWLFQRIGLLPWPRVEVGRPHSNEVVVSIWRGGHARGECCYYKTTSALLSLTRVIERWTAHAAKAVEQVTECRTLRKRNDTANVSLHCAYQSHLCFYFCTFLCITRRAGERASSLQLHLRALPPRGLFLTCPPTINRIALTVFGTALLELLMPILTLQTLQYLLR